MPDPDPISALLGRAAEKLGIRNPLEAARLFRDWPEIVGAAVAEKCRPVALKDGILKVSTASPAWASELRYLAPSVVERINRELGSEVIFQIRPAVDPSGSAGDQEDNRRRRFGRR